MTLWPKAQIRVCVECEEHGSVWVDALPLRSLHTRSILGIITVEDAVKEHSRNHHDFGGFDVVIYRSMYEKNRKLGWARWRGSGWELGFKEFPLGKIPSRFIR